MAYVEIRDVTQSFGKFTALAGVSLTVERGEFVSLIGHSGCGKSTLLNLVAGLVKPTSGFIEIDGRYVTGPGADRAMVFQHHGLFPWLTVRQNVSEPVDAVFTGRLGPERAQKREHVERLLRVVGLWEHRDKKPGQLSGGQRQRAAVARAFAIVPRMLLMDEPFGALDALTRAAMHEELLSLWSLGTATETVMMVTHDIEEAVFLSDRIVVMTNGPAATIREIVTVPFPRPRTKRAVVHDPEYAEIKAHLLDLLVERPVAGVA